MTGNEAFFESGFDGASTSNYHNPQSSASHGVGSGLASSAGSGGSTGKHEAGIGSLPPNQAGLQHQARHNASGSSVTSLRGPRIGKDHCAGFGESAAQASGSLPVNAKRGRGNGHTDDDSIQVARTVGTGGSGAVAQGTVRMASSILT